MAKRTARPTTIPGLPSLSGIQDPTVKAALTSMSEALDVRLGRRGDSRDRAITLRELIDSGLAKELAVNPYYPGSGIGIPDLPGSTIKPPKPTGVIGSGGYAVIVIFWDFPAYANHSHTEIWRYDSDSIGDAVLVGTASGSSYTDPVGGGQTYYYYLRHVSSAAVTGDWYSSAGVEVTTAPDVAFLLSQLTDAITTSQLVTSLADRINLIDGSSALPGSVNARITTSAAALQGQIDDLLAIDEYDAGVTYAIDDQVVSASKLYRCIAATTGNAPPNATYWVLIGDYTSLGALVGDNAADIVAINYVNAASTSASAQAIAGLQSVVNDPTTGLVSTRALLLSDYYTSATVDTAIASATTGLVSTAGLSAALGSYVSTATLTSNYYTAATTDIAISAAVTTLSSTLEDDYTTTVALQATYFTQADAEVLEGQYSLKIDVNGRVAGFGLSNTSEVYDGGIHSEFAVRADRFAIVNTSTDAPFVPFVVTTVPTTLNGVSVPAGVYISEAFIKNGAIGSAKIGLAAIDTAQIANAAISTAKIDDAAITSAKIANAAITTAKIATAAINTAHIQDLSVDTIKITGNAVSQTAHSYALATSSVSASFTSRAGTVMIWATFYPTGTSTRTYYIKRGTTILRSFTVGSVTSPVFMMADLPPAGLVTYYAECSLTCNRIELQTLEVLK